MRVVVGLVSILLGVSSALLTAPVEARVQIQARNSRGASTPPVITNRPTGTLRRSIPLPEIVAALQSILPYRNMNYIGVERYDPNSGVYALRFLNGRQVIVVQIDGRSGRILDRGF